MIRVSVMRLPKIQVEVLERADKNVPIFYDLITRIPGLVDDFILYEKGFIVTRRLTVPLDGIKTRLTSSLKEAYGFEEVILKR